MAGAVNKAIADKMKVVEVLKEANVAEAAHATAQVVLCPQGW